MFTSHEEKLQVWFKKDHPSHQFLSNGLIRQKSNLKSGILRLKHLSTVKRSHGYRKPGGNFENKIF